ncbi:MAG: effector binding domain-containing protein [Synechococcales cyanobacterium C42_A2020_086]|jgi:predicted transcriptional regulator YdeE|nr:effector binding domain-containing protein [Synechococcales cyanobacterium M58_A2018_015]MBF2073609.1 effector binding domain-containing protein [Synechococcales cyanobacterium C42_A2020_086]
MAEVKLMQPQWVQTQEMLVMGVEVRTTHAQEANPATAQIPALWNRVLTERLLDQIPSRVTPPLLLGVYTNYLNADRGEYSLIVATEVSDIDNPVEGMVGLTIPAADYLVFTAAGQSPESIRQVWHEARQYFAGSARTKPPFERTYTLDFERYHEAGLSLYIAVRQR